ncbi:hypothetical protein H5410_026882 [Solanum commersonii]|uniref:Retrotransposon gag domain-containing protein n=1 Tax=Solanum commersonii TaxID=4109 RepID=A0A9J5Z2T9_SOLCO|nr:hypothetical protein H5410_026882 [Solanum commersonii]
MGMIMVTMPQFGRRSFFSFETLSSKRRMAYPSCMPFGHPSDSRYNLRSKGKMTDKNDFNAAANIMMPIENPEDLAKLSATTFPTFKTPIYFAKVDLPSADLPNQPEQTQHAPAHGRVPLASPTTVRTISDLSNRDSIAPTMQKILGTHIAAPYEPYIPPVYAAGAHDASINAQLHGLRKALKSLQVIRGAESLDYDDLCIHPDIDMLVGYKPPKFDMAYCDKLVGEGTNEKLSMKLFIRSLSGETLTWYTRQDPRKWRDWQEMAEDFMNHFSFNIEITADRFSLANIQKKPLENFQEYTRR